jgi:cell division protein FtsW
VRQSYAADWFGQGPGEGTVKRILPDSHTDFVFSVLAEEFGIVLCAGIG